MDSYRVAPARSVCLSSAGPGGHLYPAAAGRRSGGPEIGIFKAERYFSATDIVRRHDAVLRTALPDHHEPPPSNSRLSVAASDVASQSGRTAASSEASWNSRSGLLSGGHHSAAVRMMGSGGRAGNASGDRYSGGNKKPSSGQRWTLFGRDCPCAGRKAVTVDVASEPRSPADARFSAQSGVEECLETAIFKAKTPSPSRPPIREEPAKMKVTVTPGSRAFPLAATDVLGVAAAPNRGTTMPSETFAAAISRRAGGFTFPALGAARLTSSILDEPPRASLEVFRPIDEDSVMLADPPHAMPVDASRGRDLVLRMPPVAAAVDDEAMSDASSDLFDLESFAASSSYPTNSANDDLPLPYAAFAKPEPSECMYAPSEASVVWSVATAEGGEFDAANFSSAASACGGMEEFRFVVPESPAEFTAAMSCSTGRKKSGGGGFLNRCRCEKAVSVGPTPVRMVKPPAYPAAKKGRGSAARCHPGRVHVPVRT